MNKILVVEDEPRIRFLIKDYLIKEGFNVIEASNGKEALDLFYKNNIHLVILDIMLPLLNGIKVLENIRETCSVPVILLTAKSEEEDKLTGYEFGADDYMTKPFSPKVLVAKVKALLKRTDNVKDTSLIEFNDLKVNRLSHTVINKDNELTLSPKEFDLLMYLIDNKNIALSRDNILDNVWGLDYFGDERVVDTTIKRLREKLGDSSKLIKTVRGSGYKFEV